MQKQDNSDNCYGPYGPQPNFLNDQFDRHGVGRPKTQKSFERLLWLISEQRSMFNRSSRGSKFSKEVS